jgi:hypothetical protein
MIGASLRTGMTTVSRFIATAWRNSRRTVKLMLNGVTQRIGKVRRNQDE